MNGTTEVPARTDDAPLLSCAQGILYVRHPENEANVLGVLSHRRVDLDLTELGTVQATRLAHYLAGACGRPLSLFTSPLKRCRSTADIIGARLGLVPVVIEDFRELDVGELEGRNDDETRKAYWRVLDAWRSGRDVAFPGGEGRSDVLARFRRGLDAVRRQGGPWSVLVAHAGILRVAAPQLLGVSPAVVEHLPTASVSRITIDGDRWQLDLVGRNDFLAELVGPQYGRKD